MIKHLNIKIHGQVHGVLFRDTAKRIADDLGVRGLVRNDPDGTVYIEAEAEEDVLKKFLEWCHVGPSSALVEKVEVSEGEMQDFDDFEIQT